SRRTGFELIGRNGVTLTDKWRDGVRTFQGLSTNGFPNCFIESIAQAGLTGNFPYLLDVQATHAAWIIAWALSHGAAEVEATPDAEAAWVNAVVARSVASAERGRICPPGYDNGEGKADAKPRQSSFFFGAPTEYADTLQTWRSAGDLAGLEIRGTGSGGICGAGCGRRRAAIHRRWRSSARGSAGSARRWRCGAPASTIWSSSRPTTASEAPGGATSIPEPRATSKAT